MAMESGPEHELLARDGDAADAGVHELVDRLDRGHSSSLRGATGLAVKVLGDALWSGGGGGVTIST